MNKYSSGFLGYGDEQVADPDTDMPNTRPIDGTTRHDTGTQELRCDCRPMGDSGLTYTGDCPLHQVVPEITMESLEASTNPEAKAVLALINTRIEAVLDRMEKEMSNSDRADSYDRADLDVLDDFLNVIQTLRKEVSATKDEGES